MGKTEQKVIQEEKECYACRTTLNLHCHHIFPGTANRKKSEQYGLKIWLCAYHHNMSDEGIHFNKAFDAEVKQMAQTYFEQHYGTREDFIKEFGKSYL